MRLTPNAYSKLNKCCLGTVIRAGSSGEAAASQSWSQGKALGAQQCGEHFWALAPSDQREHDVHNKGESTPPYHIHLMQCHHAACLCRDVMSFCPINITGFQSNWRCHMPCPNWPTHVDNSLKCLLPTLQSQLKKKSRQSNADQNPRLNNLPLVIFLLFQKQVLDKTAQAQPSVRGSSQIINLLLLIHLIFYL